MNAIKKYTSTLIFCIIVILYCHKEHIENDLQSIFYVFGIMFFIHAIFIMFAFYWEYIDKD